MRLSVALSLELSLGLDELKNYLETTEKYLQKAKSDFETSANEQAKKLSTANPNLRTDEINDILSNDYWEYAETFPTILRNSFLVSAYSLLEHKMAFICKQIQKDKGLPLSWKDLNGNTLEQFKKYCSLASLPFSFNTHAWQETKHYSKVRNCIVHYNGLIEDFKGDKDFMRYLTKKNIISKELIQEQVSLTEQFCKEVVKNIEVFLKEVIEAHDSQSGSKK